VKVLIVDEQTQTRKSLIRLCERSDDIQVVGEVSSGRTAIDAAGVLKPDLMLLDVELPDISGFELLRSLGEGNHPLGIMVASCADHAIRAFAEGALDYFVIPVTAERFDQAMVRARHRFSCAQPRCSHFASTPCELGRTDPVLPRFLVGERQRKLYPLDPKSVDYIEADGNYVTLRVGKVEYLSRDSIKRLSMQLSGLAFIRIARSLLVNAGAVAYAEVAGHGTFALTLTSGICLHSTPAYRESLLRIIPLPALSKRYGETGS
jgi:two-component system LytT family response regulator